MRFTVTLRSSGTQFTVNTRETVLEAASRHNISLPYGCRGGRCGACTATLVSGEVSYPYAEPLALDEDDNSKCLPCQAVPQSDLTIEVKEVNSTATIDVKMLPCRVHQVDHLAQDVVRLLLKLPDNQRLQFHAGQYLNFILADGRQRAFSIANAPHDDAFIELHIRHVDGGEFTDWIFNQMQARTILRIQAPLGTFILDEASTRPMLFIGGGTGFAPLKGQIEHALHVGVKRPIKLYWGVRAQDDLYLPDLPRQWADANENVAFVPVLSNPDENWQGRSGFVHEAVLNDIDNLADYDVYMAGPPIMVQAARDGLHKRGVPDEQMHFDAFEYAEDTRDKADP